jgi:hypothetical protein
MAVLYPEHAIGDRLAGVFAKHGIPVDVDKANKNRPYKPLGRPGPEEAALLKS